MIQKSNFHYYTKFRQRFDLCIFYYFVRIYIEIIYFYFKFFVLISRVRRMFRSILVNDSIFKTYQTNQLFENDVQTLRCKFQFQKQISRTYSRTTYSEIEYQFEFSILYIKIYVQIHEKVNFVCFVCFVDFFCNITKLYILLCNNFQIDVINSFEFLDCVTRNLIKTNENRNNVNHT